MESLGSDDVSSPIARKYLVGNDDINAENALRRYGYCDVIMTGGQYLKKIPIHGQNACFGVCHASSDFKRFVSRFWLTMFTELVRALYVCFACV